MNNIKILISEEEIQKRIKELSEEIKDDYSGEEVIFCPVLKGGVFFAVDLMKRYNGDCLMEFIKVSSYEGENSTGKIKLELSLRKEKITGKHIILVEDIVDTGRTFSYLIDYIKEMEPKSLKTCSLLNKESRRLLDVSVDYIGFSIDDKFVIGYGLDFDGKYRQLPYIGYLEK